MSDSVKKWHEMQGEIKASLQADKEMAAAGIGQENKNVETKKTIGFQVMKLVKRS